MQLKTMFLRCVYHQSIFMPWINARDSCITIWTQRVTRMLCYEVICTYIFL